MQRCSEAIFQSLHTYRWKFIDDLIWISLFIPSVIKFSFHVKCKKYIIGTLSFLLQKNPEEQSNGKSWLKITNDKKRVKKKREIKYTYLITILRAVMLRMYSLALISGQNLSIKKYFSINHLKIDIIIIIINTNLSMSVPIWSGKPLSQMAIVAFHVRQSPGKKRKKSSD